MTTSGTFRGRRARRHPTRCSLWYRATGATGGAVQGQGLTVDISTRGVLFTAENSLRRGQRAELTIAWPIRRHGIIPVELLVEGIIVRTEPGLAAMEIDRYQFRASALSESAPRTRRPSAPLSEQRPTTGVNSSRDLRDRLERAAAVLCLIDRRREETGNGHLGSAVERAILQRELEDLVSTDHTGL